MSRSRFELNQPLPSREGTQEVARLHAQHVARNASWRQEEAVKARCELHPEQHNDAIGDAVSRDSERLHAEHEAKHPNCAAGCSLQGWVDMPDCPVCADERAEELLRQNDEAKLQEGRYIAHGPRLVAALKATTDAIARHSGICTCGYLISCIQCAARAALRLAQGQPTTESAR